MKALSLHRPWDQAILFGPKRWENRSWAPPASIIGRVIALHASQTFDEGGRLFIEMERGFRLPMGKQSPSGAIVGVARVVAAIHKPTGEIIDDAGRDRPLTRSAFIDREARVDPWAFGPWCWLLDGCKPITFPIELRGMQGLWNLSAEVESLVRLQL